MCEKLEVFLVFLSDFLSHFVIVSADLPEQLRLLGLNSGHCINCYGQGEDLSAPNFRERTFGEMEDTLLLAAEQRTKKGQRAALKLQGISETHLSVRNPILDVPHADCDTFTGEELHLKSVLSPPPLFSSW